MIRENTIHPKKVSEQKPWYKKTWFKVFAVIMAIVIIGSALQDEDSGPTDSTSTDSAPNQVPAKTIVSESFFDYGSVYCDNKATNLQKEELFNTKYKGKYVEWTGEVASVSETLGSYTLQVKHCPDTFISDILVKMKDSEKENLLKIKEGDMVTYRAKLMRFGEILGLSASEGEVLT